MKAIYWHKDWKYRNVNSEQWIQVTLPHDAMLSESREKDAPGGSAVGFFEGGKYVYEKKWIVPTEWENQYVALEFEGVYRKSIVCLNGTVVGGCKNGYTNFIVDLTENLKIGQGNTITVQVDNSEMPNSRWYSGSGIYRPVKLFVGSKKHIGIRAIQIHTIDTLPAKIGVSVKDQLEQDEIEIQIFKEGKQVAVAQGNTAEIEIPDAKLWSEETPELYQCKVLLKNNGIVCDEAEEVFGIRKIEWNTKGLFVNGKETLLRGACVHHDNGILGAATYKESEERRVKILKEQGYNAIRSSHNPASTAMIEACDKYGVYLMDETWDMWYSHKNKYDYAIDFMNEYKKDIESMVCRDFNHPSVIMYSLGNEVSEPKDDKGVTLLKEMVSEVHLLDKTRPVSAGLNLMIIEMASKGKGIYNEEGGRSDQKKDDGKTKKNTKEKKSGSLFFNMMTSMIGTNMNRMANSKHADQVTTPVLDSLDIAGYNYASGRYPLEGKAHPNRIVYGSETFPQDIAKNWEMVKKYPYLIGDFMWTGWDYIGEAGLGAWAYGNASGFDKDYPWLLADTGACDITGFANGEAYYAATVWGLRKEPYIGVQPVNHPGVRPLKSTWRGTNAFSSWSYSGCDGNKAIVEIYSDQDFVELFLNKKSLGKKKVKEYKAVYTVKYQPGELSVVAYDKSGNLKGQAALQSANSKLKIGIHPESEKVQTDDIVYIPIQIEDQNGIVECNSDKKLTVSVENGILLGFGSANPYTMESFLSGTYTTYYGRA